MRPAIATWALGIAALSMMMFPPPPAGARGRDGAGKGLTSRAKLGKRFVSELGCPVCHVIRDQKTTARKDAPDLRREGEKVRPAWLFDFLRNPRTLRPWLKARMSNFRLTEREALAVTLFLLTQRKAGKAAPGAVRRGPPSKARLAEGKKLFDLYECGKCHPAGGKTTDAEGESLAPDFRLAARRLRAEWIPLWLKDPQAFQPGTTFSMTPGRRWKRSPTRRFASSRTTL
ncbi:MAG: hypothetical protein ACE5IM_09280 [Nitrospinota bacterium]